VASKARLAAYSSSGVDPGVEGRFTRSMVSSNITRRSPCPRFSGGRTSTLPWPRRKPRGSRFSWTSARRPC